MARDVAIATIYSTMTITQQESALSTLKVLKTYTESAQSASYAIAYVTVGGDTGASPASLLLTTTTTTLGSVPAATVSDIQDCSIRWLTW
jgi:hypothetical protein